MTLPTSVTTNRPARRPGGFTLIEVIVVVSILIVLTALLVPAIGKAYKTAQRTSQANDLQTLATALEAFKLDHGDYPRNLVIGPPKNDFVGYDGAIQLCQSLLGPTDADDRDDDDKDGVDTSIDPEKEKRTPGFRTRAGGKIYGPYVPADRFRTKVMKPDVTTPTEPETTMVFLDRFENPILYFPAATSKPNVKLVPPAGGLPPYLNFTGTGSALATDNASRYDLRDNLGTATLQGPFMRAASTTELTEACKRTALVIGDDNTNGVLDAAEQEVNQPFILWSAGPDTIYGPNASMAGDSATLEPADAKKCDDVTNFR